MIYEGSVAARFEAEWDKMTRHDQFDEMDRDDGGTLDYDEVAFMLTANKKASHPPVPLASIAASPLG